jgi:hypothetical protein
MSLMINLPNKNEKLLKEVSDIYNSEARSSDKQGFYRETRVSYPVID